MSWEKATTFKLTSAETRNELNTITRNQEDRIQKSQQKMHPTFRVLDNGLKKPKAPKKCIGSPHKCEYLQFHRVLQKISFG